MVNMALRFVVMTMCCITCCSCIESCAWGRPWNASDKSIVLGFMSNYQRTKVYLGAISLAVETVNNSTDLLPGYRLELEVMNTADKYNLKTLRSQPMTFMTKLLMERNVAAFIGPDEYCTTEAKVASAWNRPMISFKCVDPDVSNKQAFPTFARTNPPSSTVTKSVISLLHSFKWRKFAIVTSSSPKWVIVSDTIKTQAYNENVTVTGFHFYPTDYFPHHHKQNMSQIVDRTYQKTRIYVFVGEHVALFDFLICLQEHKLLDTGDYMVISVDDIEYNPKDMSNYFHRDYLDKYTMSNQRPVDLSAFRFLLKVAMTRPEMNPNYEHIAEQIKNYSFRSPFAVPYHKILVANLSVPVEGAYLYDAVMLYARAATEVLREKGNILNGTTLMRKIFKSTYHSVVGYDVRIDAQGNAEGNYTVLALLGNWNNLQGPNASRLEIIGNFVYNASHSVPVFNYVNPQREALWKKGLVKGALPKDEPLCGFFGQKCPRHEPSWRVYLILSFIAFVLLVIAAFAIKHYRYEQTLASLLWRVDMKDVTLICTDSGDVCTRNKSLVQTCRPSLITGGDTTKRAYTNIGIYRGNIVAVKQINKKTVDITREIRKELKQMRELRHENIITFIGASIDHAQVAILTTYCARGSLEDVLANEDLFLDHMFVSSLVSDILKGMIYLHDSEIISHGNLKSSNCLVDSRWVCQLTDFGLHEFKAGEEEPDRYKQSLRRGLWRAPELLRHPHPPARGTQKSDIYSLGILLYEIIGRSGPWGNTKLKTEEILKRVRNPRRLGCYFRPQINHLDIPRYVRQTLEMCWQEDPDLRPDIRLVRMKLKEMQAGLKPNIFDNMLTIMEKYAYNLEGLVQDRTHLLYEEKKKTEALLLRMLPRSVAESLKRGEPVEAECFDCVTIFFSDLVGFTEVCACSTPFEVVDMLNELYTCCDSIISNYDVYKVETIGDAYMVVSGLPIRNEDRHAKEIARMAIHILKSVSKLEIKHRPGELLRIRIGIHSGQCVAGVVGVKMPRYCLFGDTVNTASRMESTGEALKIHVSETTYSLLANFGGFQFAERGMTMVKGKGEMRTYWMLCDDDEPERSSFPAAPPPSLREFDVTPDLISNASLKNSQSQHRLSLQSIALRKRAKENFRAESDQLLNANNDCHCMINLQNNDGSSNEFIHIDDFKQQTVVMECESCTRMYRQTFMHGFPINGRREPRSAPQINFMQ